VRVIGAPPAWGDTGKRLCKIFIDDDVNFLFADVVIDRQFDVDFIGEGQFVRQAG